jgi:hypothetical protein
LVPDPRADGVVHPNGFISEAQKSFKMMRLTARVSGRIQMTGRRAGVVSLARGFGLAGFVQNLPDGRSRWVAEGEKADLAEVGPDLITSSSIKRDRY